MAYRRKPTRKPRRKARRPLRKAARTMRSTIAKVLQSQLEKKRFTIVPTNTSTQTVGDIVVNKPVQVVLAGGNFSSYGSSTPGVFTMGQSYNTTTVANTGGWSSVDITPIPLQTNETSGRVGSSITLTSAFIKFQAQQQSANVLWPIKLKVIIVENTGPSVTALQCMTDMYQNNPFTYSAANTSGFIDFNSTRQPDNFKNYRILRQMTVKVPIDPYYAASPNAALQVKDFTMKLKYNRGKGHRIRYLQNNTADLYTNISAGQLFMLFLCDAGQNNPNVAQLTNVNSSIIGSQSTASGLLVNYHLTHYYTDA